jgi:DNA-binding GntR family transcriptional regulator
MATKRKFSERLFHARGRDLLERRMAQRRLKWTFGRLSAEQLAREFGVSLQTVYRALDQMEDERRGPWSSGPAPTNGDRPAHELADRLSLVSDLSKEPYGKDGRLLQQVRRPATKIERERLQIDSGGQVLVTERARYRGGVPFIYEKACLAMGRLARIDPGNVGNYCLTDLARQCGARLGLGRERVSLTRAGPVVAEHLGVAVRVLVIRLDRMVYTPDGLPVEWQVGFC